MGPPAGGLEGSRLWGVGSMWPRLRWAPDACSLLDLTDSKVCRPWLGGSRGSGWGLGGRGHSWPCPPDAPWCGQCKALAPEYSKAAALLAAEAAKARLAKVDGPAEPELAEEFAVTEYPTLKFFRDGNRTHPEEYTGAGNGAERAGQGGAGGRGWAQAEGSFAGPREAQGIAEWLRRRVGPSATQLEDEEGARVLMRAWDVVVIGFFQVSGGPRGRGGGRQGL